MSSRGQTHSLPIRIWRKAVLMTGNDCFLDVLSLCVSRCFMRLFHYVSMKTILIKSGISPVSIDETIGYLAIGSYPTVILILYMMLGNSATSL